MKIKTTVEAHSKIKRDKAHADEDILVEYEKRKKFLDFHLESYVYNNNSKLNLKAKNFLILIETR